MVTTFAGADVVVVPTQPDLDFSAIHALIVVAVLVVVQHLMQYSLVA